MVAGQRLSTGPVAEPPQPQHRLPETSQRPVAPGRAAAAALGEQQLRNEPGPFSRDVKRGTIGDHMEPSGQKIIFGETSSTGGSTPVPGQPD
jgi:hypothetical protein